MSVYRAARISMCELKLFHTCIMPEEVDELKCNITRRVKLATISLGWTYSEGNREKSGIRVHEECQAGTQWSWKAQSGWTERKRGMTRRQDKSED